MDFKIIDVAQLKEQPIKTNMLLYGDPLAGKTTFALTFPKPFVISTDGNLNSLTTNKDARAMIINDIMKDGKGNDVYGWEVYKMLIGQLVNSPETKTIIIDNVKDIYDMCRRFVLDREGLGHENESKVRGKVWTQLEEEFFPLIRKLTTSEKNIIFVAHEKKGENVIGPNTIESVTLKLTRYMDIISRITITGLPGEEKRAITMGNKVGILGGNRVGLTGSMIEPTYEKLENEIKKERGN